MAHAGSRLKPTDCLDRHRFESQPSSRTGENPPYGMIGRIEETSASYEARSAPRSYPTPIRRHMQCSKQPVNLGAFGQILGSLTDYNLASADEDDLSVLRSIAPSHHSYIVEINPNGCTSPTMPLPETLLSTRIMARLKAALL